MIDNQFRLIQFIEKGGSSKVFLAKDELDNKWVLKIIRQDKNYTESGAEAILKREHELLKLLKWHPNIINSYGINIKGMATMEDESTSVMYNVLEHAEHGALSHFVRSTGALQELVWQFFMMQLCSAIGFIHDHGYAHLDIKLENILLDGYFNIKVADMGAAVHVSQTWGYTDKRRGTLLYMAPEVLDKSPDHVYDANKADVYSLGVTLFVMLVGEFPTASELWNNSSTEDSDRHSQDQESCAANDHVIKQWKQLSTQVQELLKAMTAIDPECRPSSSELWNHPWIQQGQSVEHPELVYEEMEWRKAYIIESLSNPKHCGQ